MLIGLCGYARSGKNSVANILTEEVGFEQMAFADALRDMAEGIDPLIEHASGFFHGLSGAIHYNQIVGAVGYEKAKEHPEVRRFLQRLGTEAVRRVFGEDAWVDAVKRRIEKTAAGTPIVLTDVRFPNEAEFVKEHGQLWRVVRLGSGPGTMAANDHPSETNQRSFVVDQTLRAENLTELREEVLAALTELRLKGAR